MMPEQEFWCPSCLQHKRVSLIGGVNTSGREVCRTCASAINRRMSMTEQERASEERRKGRRDRAKQKLYARRDLPDWMFS